MLLSALYNLHLAAVRTTKTDVNFSIKLYFLFFVRWKNDKNVQLRDFYSPKTGQCFSLRNNHVIKIICFHVCLVKV